MPFFQRTAAKLTVSTKDSEEVLGESTTSPQTLAKKFAERFEDHKNVFQHDNRFTKGLVRYKELKQHMNKLQHKFGAEFEERKHQSCQEECSICLEELGNACDVTTTTCNHKFHTYCLVETLGNGRCTSCPLCRAAIPQLVPKQIEGASLKMCAKLRINVDAAQACHKSLMKDIKKNTLECLREAEAIRTSKSSRFLSSSSSKKEKLKTRVATLLAELDLLEQFGRINSDGFSKICKKFGKVISSDLAEMMQDKYVDKQGFHKDCAESGTGLSLALKEELHSIMRMLAASKSSTKCAISAPVVPRTAACAIEA